MMEPNVSDSLIKKVRALIKLQESAHAIGSIAEAANAADKIRDILLKHNLALHEVHKEEKTAEEPIGETRMDTSNLTQGNEGGWVRKLAETIATYNLCHVIGSGSAVGIIYIIGSGTNCEVVWYTVEQLVNRLRPMARTAFKDYKGNEKRNTYIRGYLQGAVMGIGTQFMKSKLEQEREASVAETINENLRIPQATQALMIVGLVKYEKQRVKQWIDDNMKLKSVAVPTYKSQSGKVQGYQDGSSMQIHGGVSQGAQKNKSRLLD